MYRYKQEIKCNYQMANLPSEPTLPKSRGHTLFDRQARLHACGTDKTLQSTISDNSVPPLSLRPTLSIPPASVTYQASKNPLTNVNARASFVSTTSSQYPKNNNVELISINPRPESIYIKDSSSSPLHPPKAPQLEETDFPLYESSKTESCDHYTNENATSNESMINDVVDDAIITGENYVDSLPVHDDDDDVVLQQMNDNEQEDSRENCYTDNMDDRNDPDVTTDIYYDQYDNTINTEQSSDQQYDNQDRQDPFNYDDQPPMIASGYDANIEKYDSDFDDSPSDDDGQLTQKDLTNKDEEQQKELQLRQQEILHGIIVEWLRKEESYISELKKLREFISRVSETENIQRLLKKLLDEHQLVQKDIDGLNRRDKSPAMLIQYITHAIGILIETLPLYLDYIRTNLTFVKKHFEKRLNLNSSATEELLSIPPRQYLQIVSQTQDVCQTALSFEIGDTECGKILYAQIERCKLYGSQQDENINKVILKSEDVVTLIAKGNRDRCRLALYPDAIVCCKLKTNLLASPKYSLLWFISVLELQWTIPQNTVSDISDTGDELKTSLKSVYEEFEKTSKSNNTLASRLSRNIRKQENEFNLAQSKLQLLLSSSRCGMPASTIFFSSAYQLQEWVDLLDKTKQDLYQRNSSTLPQANQNSRILNDSIIQKRLDLIKPNLVESNSTESTANIQPILPSKTYSGTLCATIHSMKGSALCNSARQYHTLPMTSSAQQQVQRNYQFYVVIEIDSYNTFYPYAKTDKRSMQQLELVEFRDEVFQIELEHSLALRFLVYRIDPSTMDACQTPPKETCIGKFHRNIEDALHDCRSNPNEFTSIQSQSHDLQLTFSLNYSKRDGTFKRQPSKRSLAIFGKSIEKLMSAPQGLINGIPRIIVKCIEMVERDGLNETGIYRVCCVTSDLQKLRSEFDRHARRAEELLTQKNVHVAANLLKLFFRELPEPLFSSILYKQFLNAIQLTDADNQRVSLLKTFESLNPNNRKILFYLFDHLIRVSQYSHVNMMHLDNLAVVFGPTLMRPSKLIATTNYSTANQPIASNGIESTTQADIDQMSSELQGSMHQCQVVLAFLKLRRDGLLK